MNFFVYFSYIWIILAWALKLSIRIHVGVLCALIVCMTKLHIYTYVLIVVCLIYVSYCLDGFSCYCKIENLTRKWFKYILPQFHYKCPSFLFWKSQNKCPLCKICGGYCANTKVIKNSPHKKYLILLHKTMCKSVVDT